MQLFYRGILIICVLTLSGCSDESQDVISYVANVKKNAAGKITPLPPAKPLAFEDYTADNLRSPFAEPNASVSPEEQEAAAKPAIKQQPRPDASRTRYYLEKYPLNDFIMVGTLKKEDSMWGLVEDNNGLVHVLKVGDYIGQNSGKVVSVSESTIKLIETVPDGTGGWMPLNSEINLKQD